MTHSSTKAKDQNSGTKDGASLSRRQLLRTGSLAALAGLGLTGCDALDQIAKSPSTTRRVMDSAQSLTYRFQRMLLNADALAREYEPSDIIQPMRPNGVTDPQDADYLALRENAFQTYQLQISGLVEKPLSLSLDQLMTMPSRSQITRHDCVEGWSCIAQWKGVPLADLMVLVKPKKTARYVLIRCYDTIEQGLSGGFRYYESIDLQDAYHPQTILAYEMNEGPLPIENGAPLRLRVERQLGYKMAKYIRSIELIESFADIEGGKGGYWEDRGYAWYAGI